MGRIFKDFKEIPIPEFAHVNTSDNRVFVFIDEGKSVRNSKRKVIGKAVSESTMYPNENFRFLFPSLWQEHFRVKELPQHLLHTGLYALTLGIVRSNGLYEILAEVYGAHYANIIMDFALYSILDQSNVALNFEARMKQEVLFSSKTYSDSYLSEIFSEKISENQNYEFRRKWIEKCKEKGITNFWLSVDGSNHDCTAVNAELPEKGDAKSHKNRSIIGYMYAIDAQTGMPITYMEYNGNKVDCKAFEKIRIFVEGHQLKLKGYVLDRGFATHDIFKELNSKRDGFVIKLKEDYKAHTDMIKLHGNEIKWRVTRAVDEAGHFALSEVRQIFNNYEDVANVHLIYDGVNGTERSVTLIGKVKRAIKKINEKIALNENPKVPNELKPYLKVETKTSPDGVKQSNLIVDYQQWQQDLDNKGFSSLASSSFLNAEEAMSVYDLRDSSETQYMYMKTQLGSGVSRSHSREGIETRSLICFVASILRVEIVNACKSLGYPTNQMIKEIDRIEMLLQPDGNYVAIHDETKRQMELLSYFGIQRSEFDRIQREINIDRENPVNSEYRLAEGNSKNSVVAQKRTAGRPKAEPDTKQELKVHKKRGRPAGSKNKKTLLKEAENKRKRGRPLGSRDKVQRIRRFRKAP